GTLEQDVKNEIKTLGLSDAVTMYGVVDREKSFSLFNSHWVYAQHSVTPPSGDAEGFVISIAEAALHELPVVSTIHNGITENVIDREAGFLVPEYDYKSMAEKIVFLINNIDVAKQMGEAGRRQILTRCNPDK